MFYLVGSRWVGGQRAGGRWVGRQVSGRLNGSNMVGESVVGRSVEDLSVGRWLVVSCRCPVGGRWFCNTPFYTYYICVHV